MVTNEALIDILTLHRQGHCIRFIAMNSDRGTLLRCCIVGSLGDILNSS
jgi:hypothetical protein